MSKASEKILIVSEQTCLLVDMFPFLLGKNLDMKLLACVAHK